MVVLSSGDDRLHCTHWTLGAVTALSFIDFAGRRRGILVKLCMKKCINSEQISSHKSLSIVMISM